MPDKNSPCQRVFSVLPFAAEDQVITLALDHVLISSTLRLPLAYPAPTSTTYDTRAARSRRSRARPPRNSWHDQLGRTVMAPSAMTCGNKFPAQGCDHYPCIAPCTYRMLWLLARGWPERCLGASCSDLLDANERQLTLKCQTALDSTGI
jgi:hypothetical protein